MNSPKVLFLTFLYAFASCQADKLRAGQLHQFDDGSSSAVSSGSNEKQTFASNSGSGESVLVPRLPLIKFKPQFSDDFSSEESGESVGNSPVQFQTLREIPPPPRFGGNRTAGNEQLMQIPLPPLFVPAVAPPPPGRLAQQKSDSDSQSESNSKSVSASDEAEYDQRMPVQHITIIQVGQAEKPQTGFSTRLSNWGSSISRTIDPATALALLLAFVLLIILLMSVCMAKRRRYRMETKYVGVALPEDVKYEIPPQHKY